MTAFNPGEYGNTSESLRELIRRRPVEDRRLRRFGRARSLTFEVV
jgi:hypothetical protein